MASAATGYKEHSTSVQKLEGELFIVGDVCPQAGDVILDLGCGTGELSEYMAKLVGPEGKVVAVDPDKERLFLAQQSYGEIPNLSFVDGSDENFPGLGSEAYDIIFCHLVLHWIPNKQRVFHNMYKSLKKGGKIAIQYGHQSPPFMLNAFKVLNPENEERLCQMLVCEPRVKIEQYCTSASFVILKSYEFPLTSFVFENIDDLLKWMWSTTHGVFDPSCVTEERVQRYLAICSDEDGKPSLDFRGVKENSAVCRLVAVKQAASNC